MQQNLPAERLNELLSSDELLISETALQLQRDLQKTGWEGSLDYRKAYAFEDLKIKLTQILESYFNHQTDRFFRLIYIIDLPETTVRQLLNSPDSFATLAQMVIFRECTKVLLRRSL